MSHPQNEQVNFFTIQVSIPEVSTVVESAEPLFQSHEAGEDHLLEQALSRYGSGYDPDHDQP
jgi:hypothetical protein